MNQSKTHDMKKKKDKQTEANISMLKATRKADREMEYALKGAGWHAKTQIVKSKKIYDRKAKWVI